jgi:hypothetical protein
MIVPSCADLHERCLSSHMVAATPGNVGVLLPLGSSQLSNWPIDVDPHTFTPSSPEGEPIQNRQWTLSFEQNNYCSILYGTFGCKSTSIQLQHCGVIYVLAA